MSEQHNSQETLDLRSYLRPLWRRRWVVLAIVAVAAAAAYFFSARQPKTYESSTRVYVQTADPTQAITAPGSAPGAPNTPSTQSIADVAQLAVSQSVTGLIGHVLGMPASSAGTLTASPDATGDFVNITAASQSPVLAARLANADASALLQWRAQAVANEAVKAERAAGSTLASIPPAASAQRQSILQRIGTYREIALNPSPGASQIDPAIVPTLAASPRPMRNAIFAAAVGLVLAIIVAFVLELLDRRLTRVSSLESMYGRPVVAVLPHVSNPSPLISGRPIVPSEFVEELRSLSVLIRLGGDELPRTIMITSALPREGKSTLTRDLALVCAESGQRVLVIDGDLRRPAMVQLFGVDPRRGLAHVLREEASASEVVIRAVASPAAQPSSPSEPQASPNGRSVAVRSNSESGLFGSVDLLSHGEWIENPLPLLFSVNMTSVLTWAAENYDVVFLDTPPVLTVAEGVPLLEVVDRVLLVARLGYTTQASAERFTDLIDRLADVTFFGVVANDIRHRSDDEGYGSYGRYGYGQYSAKRERRRKVGKGA